MMEPALKTIACSNCLGEFEKEELSTLKRHKWVKCGFCGKNWFIKDEELIESLPSGDEEWNHGHSPYNFPTEKRTVSGWKMRSMGLKSKVRLN